MYANALDRAIGHLQVDTGMSQARIAERMGLSMTAWRNKRCGSVALTVPELLRLSKLLDMPLDKVVGILPDANRP